MRVRSVYVSVVPVAEEFERFFQTEFPRLVALATMVSGNQEVARELAQETMFRAHQRWDEIRHFDRPDAWLRRVLRNLLIDHHRSEQSRLAAVGRLRHTPGSSSIVAEPTAGEWSDLVRDLDTEERIVVTLYYAEDRSIRDIGRCLELSGVQIKTLLARARRRIRRQRTNRGTS